MLLPALSKAREKAREISCVNNMKQIGIQLLMYIDDYAGVIPCIQGNRNNQYQGRIQDALYMQIYNVAQTTGPMVVMPRPAL